MDNKLDDNEFEERDVLSFQDSIIENEMDIGMNLRKNSILYSLDSINLNEIKNNNYSYNRDQFNIIFKNITLLEIKSDFQIENTMESIQFLYKEYKSFHVKIFSFLSITEKLEIKKDEIIKIIIENIIKEKYISNNNSESLIELNSLIDYKENLIFIIIDIKNYFSLPEKAKDNILTLVNIISNEFLLFADNDYLFKNEKNKCFTIIEEKLKFSNFHHINDVQCDEFLNNVEKCFQRDNNIFYVYDIIIKELLSHEKKGIILFDVEINCSILLYIIQTFIENYNYDNCEDNKINIKSIIKNGQFLEIKGIKDEEILKFRDSISNMAEIKSNSEIFNHLINRFKKYIEQFFIGLNKDLTEPFINNIILLIEELNFEIKEKFQKNESLFEINFHNKLKYQIDNFFYQQNEIEISPAIDLNNLINSITYFFLDFKNDFDDSQESIKTLFNSFIDSISNIINSNSKLIIDKIQQRENIYNENIESLKDTINNISQKNINLEKMLNTELNKYSELKYDKEKIIREFEAFKMEKEVDISSLTKENENNKKLIMEKDESLYKMKREITKLESEAKKNSIDINRDNHLIFPNETLKVFHGLYFDFKETYERLTKEKSLIMNKKLKEKAYDGFENFKCSIVNTFKETFEKELNDLKENYINQINIFKQQIYQETSDNIKKEILLKKEYIRYENLNEDYKILQNSFFKLNEELKETSKVIDIQKESIQNLEELIIQNNDEIENIIILINTIIEKNVIKYNNIITKISIESKNKIDDILKNKKIF